MGEVWAVNLAGFLKPVRFGLMVVRKVHFITGANCDDQVGLFIHCIKLSEHNGLVP